MVIIATIIILTILVLTIGIISIIKTSDITNNKDLRSFISNIANHINKNIEAKEIKEEQQQQLKQENIKKQQLENQRLKQTLEQERLNQIKFEQDLEQNELNIKKTKQKLKLQELEQEKLEQDLKKQKAEEQKNNKNQYKDFRLKYKANIRCEDGHFVRSQAEKRIADFFFYNGIRYIYESEYYNQSRQRKFCPDFWLPDYKLIIEYFGLNNENYIKEKNEKINIYRSDPNINFEYLDQKDYRKIEIKLKLICQKYNIPTKERY